MDVGCTLDIGYNYKLKTWAPTSASRTVSAVAELPVTERRRCRSFGIATRLKGDVLHL